MNNERKSSGLPLLPFLIFIAIYMGAGIILQIQGVEMAFYWWAQMPAKQSACSSTRTES